MESLLDIPAVEPAEKLSPCWPVLRQPPSDPRLWTAEVRLESEKFSRYHQARWLRHLTAGRIRVPSVPPEAKRRCRCPRKTKPAKPTTPG